MEKQMKKFVPFLVSMAACLTIAIILFAILPWLIPTSATDKDERPTENEHSQIDENPSINDQNGNQGNTTTGGETTTPTKPVDPEPTEPTDPVDPEPVDPEPEPIFVLTVDSLPGTRWYYAERGWYLIFTKKNTGINYQLVYNDESMKDEKGTCEVLDNIIYLQKGNWYYSYANNTLADKDGYGYTFVLVPSDN